MSYIIIRINTAGSTQVQVEAQKAFSASKPSSATSSRPLKRPFVATKPTPIVSSSISSISSSCASAAPESSAAVSTVTVGEGQDTKVSALAETD